MDNLCTISFPEAKNIVVSGDIHGDFNQVIFKLCVQYQMTDTVIIVAGDCGFGFEQKEYYDQMARYNAKRMNEAAVGVAENVPCVCHILVAPLAPSAVEVTVHAVDKLAVVYPYMRAAIV